MGALLPEGAAVPTGHASAMHDVAFMALGVGDQVPEGHGVQSLANEAPGA